MVRHHRRVGIIIPLCALQIGVAKLGNFAGVQLPCLHKGQGASKDMFNTRWR
jgi:hypothetical protein